MANRTQTSNSAELTITSVTASTVEATGLGSWVGYHVALVSSSTTSPSPVGQMRYAYDSAGRTDVLRVTPEFEVVPTVGDDLFVAKNHDDYDADYGNDFKLVLKATSEWDVGADSHTMGDGTNHMVGGIYNQALSQDEYWYVRNGSYFAVGALFAGESLGGWYWNSNNANSTLGYQYIRVESSATLMMHNCNCGTVYAHSVLMEQASRGYFYDVSFTNLMYDGARIKGQLYGNNLKFQGNGVANDYVVVASAINTFTGPIILSDCYGFYSSAANETIHINKYISVNNQQDVVADNSTTWEFHNPVWQNPQITWTQTAGESQGQSTVSEIFTLTGESLTTAGSTITSAIVVLTQGSANARTAHVKAVVSTDGRFQEDVLHRYWASSTASTTYGPFVARAWHYGYQPFEGAIVFDEPIELALSLAVDAEITNATYASAKALTPEFSDETITYDGVWYVETSVIATAVASAVMYAHDGYNGTLRETYVDGEKQEYIFVITSSTSTEPPQDGVIWFGTSAGGANDQLTDPSFDDASQWDITFGVSTNVSAGAWRHIGTGTNAFSLVTPSVVVSTVSTKAYAVKMVVSVTTGDALIDVQNGGQEIFFSEPVSTANQGTFYGYKAADAGGSQRPIVFFNVVSGPFQFAVHEVSIYPASTVYGRQVVDSGHKYTYHIDAKNQVLTDAYDKQQACFADVSTTDVWVSTARLRNSHLMNKTGTNYNTESYFSTGVFVTNRGAGTIDYMTADDGFQFVPPVQYSFEFTGLEPGSEVRLFASATKEAIDGTESSGSTYTYNYTYGGADVAIYAVILHLDYEYVRIGGLVLSDQNQSIPIQQTVDRVFSNP